MRNVVLNMRQSTTDNAIGRNGSRSITTTMTRNQSKHHTAGDWSPSDSKYTHCWRVLEQHAESLQESIYCCSFTGAQCSQADRYSLCFSDKSQNSCSNRSSTGSSLKVCDTAVTDAGYRDLDTWKTNTNMLQDTLDDISVHGVKTWLHVSCSM